MAKFSIQDLLKFGTGSKYFNNRLFDAESKIKHNCEISESSRKYCEIKTLTADLK